MKSTTKSTKANRPLKLSLWSNPANQWKRPFANRSSLLDPSVTIEQVRLAVGTRDEQSRPFEVEATADALRSRVG